MAVSHSLHTAGGVSTHVDDGTCLDEHVVDTRQLMSLSPLPKMDGCHLAEIVLEARALVSRPHSHAVQHTPCADTIRIPRRPSNLDRMNVWISSDK